MEHILGHNQLVNIYLNQPLAAQCPQMHWCDQPFLMQMHCWYVWEEKKWVFILQFTHCTLCSVCVNFLYQTTQTSHCYGAMVMRQNLKTFQIFWLKTSSLFKDGCLIIYSIFQVDNNLLLCAASLSLNFNIIVAAEMQNGSSPLAFFFLSSRIRFNNLFWLHHWVINLPILLPNSYIPSLSAVFVLETCSFCLSASVCIWLLGSV